MRAVRALQELGLAQEVVVCLLAQVLEDYGAAVRPDAVPADGGGSVCDHVPADLDADLRDLLVDAGRNRFEARPVGVGDEEDELIASPAHDLALRGVAQIRAVVLELGRVPSDDGVVGPEALDQFARERHEELVRRLVSVAAVQLPEGIHVEVQHADEGERMSLPPFRVASALGDAHESLERRLRSESVGDARQGVDPDESFELPHPLALLIEAHLECAFGLSCRDELRAHLLPLQEEGGVDGDGYDTAGECDSGPKDA